MNFASTKDDCRRIHTHVKRDFSQKEKIRHDASARHDGSSEVGTARCSRGNQLVDAHCDVDVVTVDDAGA